MTTVLGRSVSQVARNINTNEKKYKDTKINQSRSEGGKRYRRDLGEYQLQPALPVGIQSASEARYIQDVLE